MVLGRIPILLYHSLTSRASPAYRRFAVDPGVFRTQMDLLAEAGVRTATIGELVALGSDVPPATVAITFDDGFAELIDVALPILRDRGLRATAYLVSGYIGGTSQWLERDGEGDRPLISWEDARSLEAEGLEVGGHGHRHLSLDLLGSHDAFADIDASRRILEDGLGRRVDTFAYPYGYHTNATKVLVRQAGYTSACGVKHAFSHAADDRFAIARIIVGAETSQEEFAAWIRGAGQLPDTWPGERLRTRVWRMARRAKAVVERGPVTAG
jgi:peptidoglycan/xylan/chitin deacetylase (PgdA/CDA1 family)